MALHQGAQVGRDAGVCGCGGCHQRLSQSVSVCRREPEPPPGGRDAQSEVVVSGTWPHWGRQKLTPGVSTSRVGMFKHQSKLIALLRSKYGFLEISFFFMIINLTGSLPF